MSWEVVGVRILRRADSIAVRIVASTPGRKHQYLAPFPERSSSLEFKQIGRRTFEAASFDASKLSFYTITQPNGRLSRNVFAE